MAWSWSMIALTPMIVLHFMDFHLNIFQLSLFLVESPWISLSLWESLGSFTPTQPDSPGDISHRAGEKQQLCRKMRGTRRDKSPKQLAANVPWIQRTTMTSCSGSPHTCVCVRWDSEKERGIAKVAVWMMFNWSSAQLNEAVNPLSPGCSYSECRGTELSQGEGCRHITVARARARTHTPSLPPTRRKI